jgi:4-aminobutyrate aminotransferase
MTNGANDDIVTRSGAVFTTALHNYYPIAIERGEGCRVHDREGKSYMDFSSGLAVLNIGHNHPRVMQRVARQLSHYVHTGGIYYNETTVAAAEQLTAITPTSLNMLFFSNSGAEAVEGALKLARHATGRQGVIAFHGAFHGRTLGALSVTSSSARYRERYHPLLPSVYHSPYPYCFRCPVGATAETCTLGCFRCLEQLLCHVITPEEVAAIIIEPILGEGGYIPAQATFLAGLRRLCDAHGILLIFDEVQSGVGRTGDWFAAQSYGITPDILTVAKGIASGFPLSAVVSRRDLMERWPAGAHGTTFGGNPVACAAAIATIETIRDDNLLMRCRELGARSMARLNVLKECYPLIGDVRSVGLMIGIELVREDGTPDSTACGQLLEECCDHGLILINCGPGKNIIRFIPPLTISDAELDEALEIFAAALESLA